MSAVSLYYYLQVLKRAYVMPAPPDLCCIDVHPVTALVLAFIAAAVLVMGCMPAVLQSWIAGLSSSSVEDAALARFERSPSHPSDKNKDVAWMGHPSSSPWTGKKPK